MNRALRFKVRIKEGAIVGQDMSCAEWEDDGTIFDVHSFTEDKARLVACGYGVLGDSGKSYGNGALFVKKSDLIFLDNSGEGE